MHRERRETKNTKLFLSGKKAGAGGNPCVCQHPSISEAKVMLRTHRWQTALLRWLGMTLSLVSVLLCEAAHVHVQIAYANDAWDLHIFDFDSGRYDPGQITIPVSLAARSFIPDNSHYTGFLSATGKPVWILPQNEQPDILNLGLGSSRITSGTFTNNQIKLSFRRVSGPGHFSLFTSTPFGAPVVHMTSLDGVNPTNDFISVPAVAGHIHLNWAFTVAGTYCIGLAASGRLNSTGQISESVVVDCIFIVEAPPPPRLLAPRPQLDGAFVCTLKSEAHGVCHLENSVDLRNWTPFVTVTNTTGRMEIILPQTENTPFQFCRATLP